MSGLLWDDHIRLISFQFRPTSSVTTEEEILKEFTYDIHTFNLSQDGDALLSLWLLGRIILRFY